MFQSVARNAVFRRDVIVATIPPKAQLTGISQNAILTLDANWLS